MGIGTRADDVFLLEERDTGLYSEETESEVDIEDDLLRPGLKGTDIESYHFEKHRRLLFPYVEDSNEVNLIPPGKLRESYPRAWEYLNEVREALENREGGKFEDTDEWYKYSYPRSMTKVGNKKSLIPDVVNEGTASYDSEGWYILDTAYGLESEQYDERYLTVLLNTDLLTAFLNLTGTDLRGGYFRMKTAYLNPFPIPDIDFTTPDSERASRVSALLDDYEDYLADSAPAPVPDKDDVAHDFLAELAERMTEYKETSTCRLPDSPTRHSPRPPRTTKVCASRAWSSSRTARAL